MEKKYNVMEVHRVIGIYVNKFISKDGREIEYAKLYSIREDFVSDNLIGQKCEIINIPVDLVPSITIGDLYELRYNRYGKVTDIIKVDV